MNSLELTVVIISALAAGSGLTFVVWSYFNTRRK